MAGGEKISRTVQIPQPAPGTPLDLRHAIPRDPEFAAEIASGGDFGARDHKSRLQELLQGRGEAPPQYVVAAEEGPSHRRVFRVSCVIGSEIASEGEGPSKKVAQQEAARLALERLGSEAPKKG